jgi:hypothetical protein
MSRDDAIAEAALAFKVSLGQTLPPAAEPGPAPAEDAPDAAAPGDASENDDDIDAPEPADPADEGAESHDPGDDPDAAADEAQPPAIELPRSWPADKAELWTSLPPEAQAVIAEREGQRDAAVNAKFMEAANLRKTHEVELGEARTSRARALEATDLALALIQPKAPPVSMLDAGSDDYDPDGYHLAKAHYEQSLALLDDLSAQQQELRALQQQEQAEQEGRLFQAINGATQDALLRDVPDIADQAKAPAMFRELIDYALGIGAPIELFQTPTTALEWHTLWKAREYDRLQAAKARVATDPKPAPRKAQPPIRPGVTTPPGARAAARRQQNLARLERSGTIEDGAAVFRDFLSSKG